MNLGSNVRGSIVQLAVIGTLSAIGIIFIITLGLFADVAALGVFIFAFVLLSGLIYFYTGEGQGPLGIRGRYAKPFGLAAILMIVGVMAGFLIFLNAGKVLDIWGQIPLSAAAAGLGILFGMAAFLRLYRKDL